MAPDGDDPPDEDSDEGTVLAPEELDITDDDRVSEIDEGRYVISPGGGSPDPSPSSGDSGVDDEPAPEGDPEPTALTEERVRAWLADELGDSGAAYGFDVTAKFQDSVERQELFSNDVVTTFENLVMWYAQHAGGDTPVEEVLGLLLTEANAPVRYPPKTLRALAAAKGLEGDDTIADLIAAYENEGVRFPP